MGAWQQFVTLVSSAGVPPAVYSASARSASRLADAKHHHKERVKIQLVPANLHWCSDAALEMLADFSARYEAPMHMHLVETAYQKEYASRRGGGTGLDYINRFGFLGPPLTLGHGVWLNEADLDRIAATGTHIRHNCSSPGKVLRMAAVGGAATTPFGSHIGTIAVGRSAGPPTSY